MVYPKILDEIWAEQAGIAVRFIALKHGKLRIEFAAGIGGPSLSVATLADWRVKRAAFALKDEFLHLKIPSLAVEETE